MVERRKGWILNLHDGDSCREIESTAEPVLTLDDGAVVFEVWHWDQLLRRWFAMSTAQDDRLAASGVVYYHPREVPDGLRARVRLLEKMQGVRR